MFQELHTQQLPIAMEIALPQLQIPQEKKLTNMIHTLSLLMMVLKSQQKPLMMDQLLPLTPKPQLELVSLLLLTQMEASQKSTVLTELHMLLHQPQLQKQLLDQQLPKKDHTKQLELVHVDQLSLSTTIQTH